jgi:aminodeoxyfutalosine deaminase
VRKISASYIYPCNRPPLKNGILISDDTGVIFELIDTGGNLQEQAGLEHYSGILIPGFVNAHCHLELSHMKGKIPEKTSLGGFLGKLHNLRNTEDDKNEEAIEKADFQMQSSGIAAVGDISNSLTTLETKSNSNLYYHTFAEAFGFHPSRAEKAFQMADFVYETFRESGLSASVTPHSFYSVSELLFRKIEQKAQKTNSIISIHNQESLAEAQFFEYGSGPVFHHLKYNLGLDMSHWNPGKENLPERLKFIPKENSLLLVHNTCTTHTDISLLKKQRTMENTFFVLCPNSNLYIENKLPKVPLFQQENLNVCLGTDSLASNHRLSVLYEMITLQKHFPELTMEKLAEWACLNGARALGIDNRYGSFEPGKKPGINLITGVDLQQLKLTSNSKIKVLESA